MSETTKSQESLQASSSLGSQLGPQLTGSSISQPSTKIAPPTEAELKRVEQLRESIKLEDTNSILAFGTDAHKGLSTQANAIMDNVRNKDSGEAGVVLNDLLTKLRGIDPQESGLKGFLAKFGNPVLKFIQRYEQTSNQLDSILARLETSKLQMIKDVTVLDNLYGATQRQIRDLELCIEAGTQKLTDWNTNLIPELQRRADESNDMADAQKLRDAAQKRDSLERKLSDLAFVRLASIQSLPQLREVQTVDKGLAETIQTSILTTLPIWRQQIAMGITMARQAKAIELNKAVKDTTNDMLRRNAEMIRTQSAAGRKEIERGVIDLDTLKKVHEEMVATLEQSIQTTREAKEKRAAAAIELQTMEDSLRKVVASTAAAS